VIRQSDCLEAGLEDAGRGIKTGKNAGSDGIEFDGDTLRPVCQRRRHRAEEVADSGGRLQYS
jgi:hypothetical protein